MTTPNTNFDVNLTRGNSGTYSQLVERAGAGRLAEGDPLAWTYLHSTWNNADQTHHLLASQVVQDCDVARRFNELRHATIGVLGGAYVFYINNPGNLMPLPKPRQPHEQAPHRIEPLH